ncbi:thiol reductant ABC exporter subunit CydC [Acetobacteraceae bacterium ESL0709]|nr:thiol reductant ABC exporter subunit CydC [Acetobacteraceae bacterium ESL0697]MDF7678034.1 thiol reductant ABC exporter subunit CydC [Acetobacteraceae bacterium ESL0709]
MKSLLTIMALWRPHKGRLLLGVIMAALAFGSSLLLMGQAGTRLAGAAIGIGAGFYLLRFAGVARLILRYFERYMTHDALFRALTDLRVWFFRKLAHSSALGIGRKRSGDLLSRLVADIQSLDNLYIRIIVPLVVALLSAPFLFVFCAKGSIGLAFIVTFLFCLMVIGVPLLAGVYAYRMGPHLLKARSALYSQSLDIATGLREARLFQAEQRMTDVLFLKEQALYKAQRHEVVQMTVCQTVAAFLSRCGVLLTLLFAGGVYFHHPDIVHNLTLFFVVMTIFDQFVDLPRAGFLAGEVLHAAQRVTEPLTSEGQIIDHGGCAAPVAYELVAEHLTFGWQKERPLFEDVRFTLKEGERIALLGASGNGKSSLTTLLMGITKPWEGTITLGGVSVSDIDSNALRQKIGWLSQSSHLFDDTIRNNLLLGEKGVSDQKLWEALEKAQLADFVRALPDGLDCWVGENGSALSGGQGRRLALARVLLREASILILDEPTEGLDRETQEEFIRTLNKLDARISVLLITHRMTGLEKVSHVLRLEDGNLKPVPF